MIKLTDNKVRILQVAKVFRENVDEINSLDFSPDGDFLVSSSADDQIIIYDCVKGEVAKIVNSKKYGVDLIRFGHTNTTVIYSSTKVDNTIRYLSLHDNKYLRYFTGHTNKVVTLCKSPIEDLFVSGSLDRSLRLWDLRTPNCQGYINIMGRPVASFDPEGLVLAAGINSETVKLFDIRSFDKGPFITIKLPPEKECDWTELKFSGDGVSLLMATNGYSMRLVNAFNGAPIQTFTGYMNTKRIPIEASFSPDSQYIFGGSSDGVVHVWNSITGYKVCALRGNHPGPVKCVKFNPKYMMLASACTNLGFWLPGDNTNLFF